MLEKWLKQTVNKMQLNYDYFTSDKCLNKISKVQTNPRYKNFTQLYYTAGDVEQFWAQTNLKDSNCTTGKSSSDSNNNQDQPTTLENNLFKDVDTFQPSHLYQNITKSQVEDTFNYIFHKFKKGIYIKIQNGQLATFLPFSKAFYVNEWSNLIQVDPKYKTFENFFKVHNDLLNKVNGTNYRFNLSKVNNDPSFWYANNCILRYENPINEGETNYPQLKSMFLELCVERHVPDMEFFVNKRDFPLLTRDGTEPYTNIYGDNVPLKSYKFDRYAPILSMCTSDKYADVAIPTHEDWARIKSGEGIFFPQKCRNYSFKFNHRWIGKKNMAVFRGSNTGCGYNQSNNTRLKLAKLGAEYPQLLDAGITNWNFRIRKNKDSPYLQIPDIENLALVGKLSPEQQSNYKYLINADGHVSAFRLSLELSMRCCILLVESSQKWKMWFSDMLEPYVHYVPIKADLSDLISQLQWCLKNDDKCEKMAHNSLNFYKKYLTKKGVLDYLQNTLFRLKEYTGYQLSIRKDPLLYQMDMELGTLHEDNKVEKHQLTWGFPQNIGRNYGILKGLEKFILHAIKPHHQITLAGVEVHTIFQSKTTKVVLYQIGTEYVVGKRTIDAMKKLEFVHEAFIGKHVLNNLLKLCPNFVYTLKYREEPYISYSYADYPNVPGHGEEEETTILQEYIKGPTLQEFLTTSSFKSYLEIILGLQCALLVAQTNYSFVHHDLKPWNVVVNVLDEPIILDYYLRTENEVDVTYKLKTRYIPVILDYGKSHVIYNNVHYGIIKPFETDKNIDLVTMLISTLNELTLQQNENLDPDDLLHIVNFFTKKRVNNIHELKQFLSKNKKFGNLNMDDIDLSKSNTSKNIFEAFFKYITPLTKKYKISFGKDKLTLEMWSSNPAQIADMGFGSEFEDQVNSYLEVVRRIYKSPMPQATNKFTTIMIAQRMIQGILAPKMEFIEFATLNKLDVKKVQKILKEIEKMENFVGKFYTTQLTKKVKEPFNIGLSGEEAYKKVLEFKLKPTRHMFLDTSNHIKEQINQEMKDLPAQFPDYLYYRSLIVDVLRNRGPFQIQEEDKLFYMDNFKLIFDEMYISKVVDIETIRFYMNL